MISGFFIPITLSSLLDQNDHVEVRLVSMTVLSLTLVCLDHSIVIAPEREHCNLNRNQVPRAGAEATGKKFEANCFRGCWNLSKKYLDAESMLRLSQKLNHPPEIPTK